MTIALLAAASSVHTLRWANAFAERGHVVHLISQHAPLAGYDRRVSLHRLPHLLGAGYLLNGPRLAALLRRIRPDVLNAHYASGYGTLARWSPSTPVVMNVWGSDVFEFPDASLLHRFLVLGNLQRARHVVSTSRFMAERTARLGPGLPPIEVVPFGVDTEVFRPAAAEPEGPVVIGTVKTLARKYGIDILLRAFAIVRQRHPDVVLRIVGDGPQAAELKALAVRLGIASSVDFTGPVPHAAVPGVLQGFHIFAALSRADSETFGVAVIEASACGLPVVVSDAGGLPEVVLDGATGHVVRRNDPDAAAERLVQLVASADARRAMGREGRAHVEREYRWAACVDRQLAVFQGMLLSGARA